MRELPALPVRGRLNVSAGEAFPQFLTALALLRGSQTP